MRFATALVGSAVALSFALPPTPASAGCNEEVIANVAMAPGRSCWVYRGSATVFTGEFGGGQRIMVRMSDGHLPSVSGPDNFNKEADGGTLAFFAPQGGIYPCALWGSPAAVEICAR